MKNIILVLSLVAITGSAQAQTQEHLYQVAKAHVAGMCTTLSYLLNDMKQNIASAKRNDLIDGYVLYGDRFLRKNAEDFEKGGIIEDATLEELMSYCNGNTPFIDALRDAED